MQSKRGMMATMAMAAVASVTGASGMPRVHVSTRRRDELSDEVQEARIKAAQEKRTRKALTKGVINGTN